MRDARCVNAGPHLASPIPHPASRRIRSVTDDRAVALRGSAATGGPASSRRRHRNATARSSVTLRCVGMRDAGWGCEVRAGIHASRIPHLASRQSTGERQPDQGQRDRPAVHSSLTSRYAVFSQFPVSAASLLGHVAARHPLRQERAGTLLGSGQWRAPPGWACRCPPPSPSLASGGRLRRSNPPARPGSRHGSLRTAWSTRATPAAGRSAPHAAARSASSSATRAGASKQHHGPLAQRDELEQAPRSAPLRGTKPRNR